MKYYIAQNYEAFRQHCRQARINHNEVKFIKAGRMQDIAGICTDAKNIEIIGDPEAPWSFWHRLMFVAVKNF